MRTPLFDALKEYVSRDTLPFHVPGHKKGIGTDKEFLDFIGANPFKIDVTVFQLVDSLHHPKGPIKEAQELAALAYGADHSFFSIHGTTGAIQAMIMSVVSPNEKILVPRNVHKSVTAAIILSGAVPVYMTPEVDKKLGIAHGVTPETVEETLKENPDAKAVLIINPTYYGVATDIKKISDIVHKYNIPFIVDEAHGPHLKFSNKLPLSALDAGADICAQSTHKIIGSLTQASLLHVKGTRVNPKRVQQMLNLLQTTSPSYILMASLDCARRQIATEGTKLLEYAIDLSNYARDEINKIPGFYCFGKEIIGTPGSFSIDPTKLTISCRELGITGYELERILADDYHIQMELADFYNVLAVGSFGDTKDGMNKLIKALKEISDKYIGKNTSVPSFLDIPDIPSKMLNPRDAFYSDKRSIPLSESVGKISAEFLLAYPPGIPILCPGELISEEIIKYVEDLKRANLYVQGTEDHSVNNINVLYDFHKA
jgi:arginine/lysine/ornithine decarboxylase